MLFPLITFPYISRVLHVENIGIYNFCQSVISYFTLAAGLGINTYAVREGARYRENKTEMSEFASEIFSINLISTILSYLILIFCIICLPRLNEDAPILFALSINIIFTTIGCEWVFQIYEDFAYITIRSIIFQFISLALMFCFVRSSSDLIVYAAITSISTSGSNIINAVSRRKYCKIKLVFNRSMGRRLTSILILFANSVATTIYVNSDSTMLGIFSTNTATGLYYVSTKIYTLVKTLVGALIVVSIPRLSAFLGKEDYESFDTLANQILNALVVVVVPAMVGIFALSRNIILIISGSEYLDANISLKILSVALLFSIFSWFYTSCILIPCKQERKVLIATIVAASANIALNFILIPLFAQNAAAFTTLVAELLSMSICYICGRKYFKTQIAVKDIVSVILGCIAIVAICYFADKCIKSLLLSTCVAIGGSVIVYLGLLILMKNRSVNFILNTTRHKKL